LVREQPDLSTWATVQSSNEPPDELGEPPDELGESPDELENEAHANAPNTELNQTADIDIALDELAIASKLPTRDWRLSRGVMTAAIVLSVGAIASVAIIGWHTTIRSPQSAPTVDLFNLPCNEPPLPNVSAQTPDYIYENGTEFYGEFAGNVPTDGRGTMIFANGDRYDGEYQDGRRNGCGTFTFDNGRQYVGQFENDLFEGLGIWTLETGDRYVGEFYANKCHGEGTFQFTDGSSETGTWHNGSLVNGDLSCGRGSVNLPDSL
jgi:tetrahydromethanopterin S-methyltransferase subunit F